MVKFWCEFVLLLWRGLSQVYPLHKNLWFYQCTKSLWTRRFLCKLYRTIFTEPIGGLFRLVQERWHHLRHLSQITLLSSLEMCLWQARHTHPLFSFLWKFSSAAYHPVWLKYFSPRWISIFSSRTVSGIALKPNRLSIDRSLEPSIAATASTLFVKHSSMTLIFSNGLSFEKGLG